jgi:ApaG protein
MRDFRLPVTARAVGPNYVETTMAQFAQPGCRAVGGRLVPDRLFAMMPADLEGIARMYRAVTRQIEVTVEPNFLPERSSVERREYFWSYTIVITNTGDETVQLRTRHWIITDASGRKQEVRGEGVVGE